MINDEKKYIFVHIPKTGGTSIERYLLELEGVKFNPKSRLPLSTLSQENQKKYLLAFNSIQHQPLEEFDADKQLGYFSFCFVRNPWDLMVSEFLYFQKIFGKVIEFPRFIEVTPIQGFQYHCHPYLYFLNEHMTFIGRFESLQEDFDYVCGKLDLPKGKLPFENKSNRDHYRSFYNDKTRDMVAEKYKTEIEMFGYAY